MVHKFRAHVKQYIPNWDVLFYMASKVHPRWDVQFNMASKFVVVHHPDEFWDSHIAY